MQAKPKCSRPALDYRIPAIATILLWSTSPAILRRVAGSFTPLPASLLRLLFATAALVLFGCLKRIGFPKWRDAPP